MMSRLIKNVGLSLIAAGMSLVAGIVCSIIAARALSAVEFGLYSLVTWMVPTVSLLLNTGVSSATMKFVAELEGAQQHTVGNRLTLLLIFVQCALGLLAGLTIFVFAPQISQSLHIPTAERYLPAGGLAILLSMISIILRNRLAGLHRYDLISAVISISSVLLIIGTYVAINFNYGVNGLIYLSFTIYFIEALLYILFVSIQRNLFPTSPIQRALIHRVWNYCMGVFLLTSVEAILWQRSELFFFGFQARTSDIAYYGLSYSLTTALAVLGPTTISSVLMPVLSQHFGAGNRSKMQKVYTYSIRCVGLIVLPISLGGIAISSSLLQLCYGEQYIAATASLQILFIAAIANALSFPVLSLFVGLGKPTRLALLYAPIALMNIMLALSLTQSLGATGAAVAKLTCQVSAVLLSISYLHRTEGFYFPVLNLARTMVAAIAVACSAFLIITYIPGWVGLILAIVCATALYLPALIATSAISAADTVLLQIIVDSLPKNLASKLRTILRRFRFSNVSIS